MTNDDFERVDGELLAHASSVLLNRKAMYARDTDRLANFKETALRAGITPEKVCEIYLEKALSAMIKILHGAPAIGETLNDRFADPLNYVRLAYALVRDRDMKPTKFLPLREMVAGATTVGHPDYLCGSASKAADDIFPPRAGNRILD